MYTRYYEYTKDHHNKAQDYLISVGEYDYELTPSETVNLANKLRSEEEANGEEES